jgi:RNA ligase (TIGR02306 family)
MKDATIEIISEIKNHPKADRLDLAKVLGFQCVVQKGLYKGGEKIVYIRPDSLLPVEPWAEDYRKYSPNRIKAVLLREEWSKGIIVPFEILPIREVLETLPISSDVSELIGVTHWVEPTPVDPHAKGMLPLNIPKTDEERWENFEDGELPYGELVDAFLKEDGQSNSFGYHLESDRFVILRREQEMHPHFENVYTAHVKRYDIQNKLVEFCKTNNVSLCLRGESCGDRWVMFSVYNIDSGKYERKGSRFYFTNVAKELGLPAVENVEQDVTLTKELCKKYSSGISKLNGKPFEGVVVQHSSRSFKIINDFYDSKK